MKTWPHAPSKIVTHPGTYFITAGTYHKQKLFDSPEKLDYLHDFLLEVCLEKSWQLQAWAIFSNHYHLIGFSPDVENAASDLTRKLHGKSAIELNKMDSLPGRIVWYESWDTRISFEKSYLARLSYVHWNPVRHGLVKDPCDYKWCSARWFRDNCDVPFYRTVAEFPHDEVKVYDEF